LNSITHSRTASGIASGVILNYCGVDHHAKSMKPQKPGYSSDDPPSIV
jgi:hypothetical protein